MGGVGISNKNYFCDIFFFEIAKRKIGQRGSFKDRNGLNIDCKMEASSRVTNHPGLPGTEVYS